MNYKTNMGNKGSENLLITSCESGTFINVRRGFKIVEYSNISGIK